MKLWLAILIVFAQVAGVFAQTAHAHVSANLNAGDEAESVSIASAAPDVSSQHDTGTPGHAQHGCDRCSHSLGYSLPASMRLVPPLAWVAGAPAQWRASCRADTCLSLPFEPPR